MKKIISMFCTLAMVLSMAVVAHADENNYVEFKLVSKEGGNAVVEAHLVTNENIVSMAMFWDVSDAGASNVTFEKGTCSQANYTKAQNQIMTNYSNVEPITGDVVMATFTFEGVTEDFDISLKPLTQRTKTYFKNSDNVDVTDKFTTATQTIKLVEEEEVPEVKTTVSEKAAVSNPTEAKTVGVLAESPEGLIFNKLSVILNNGSVDSDPVVIYDGVSIDAPTAFGLNIMQVPAGVTITVTDVVAE